MIVDTSALVAIVAREPSWSPLVECLEAATRPAMSAVSVVELTIVLSSPRFGLSAEEVRRLLDVLGIETVDFTAAHAELAVEAHSRFGRGNHSARLNFGDCIAYATSKAARDSLLFVGDDFSQTDVVSALG